MHYLAFQPFLGYEGHSGMEAETGEEIEYLFQNFRLHC